MTTEPTRQQLAADALKILLRGGGSDIQAAIAGDDPAARREAARKLLHGTPLGDPEAAAQRKEAARVALADYGSTSMGRGTPKYAPDAAAAAIESTGITYAGHDSTGETF